MTTEQKIREAFDKWVTESCDYPTDIYEEFRAGYLALLNDLEIASVSMDRKHLYRLPEGVEKP